MRLILNKLRFLLPAVSVLLLLISCESSSEVGVEVRPASDALAVKTCCFPVETSLVTVDSIYGRGRDLMFGVYSDPLFGTVKADFLAELHYIADTFPANSVGDSLVFVLFYREFFGDSLSVQEMSAYQLDAALDFSTDYYSNIRPADFTDCSRLFARTSYVPYDLTVPDDTRSSSYVNQIRVRMPDEMMRTLMSDPSLAGSQEAFRDFLNGLYVTNSYGDGCMVMTDSVNLELTFHVNLEVDTGVVRIPSTRIYGANLEATEVQHISYPLNDRPTAAGMAARYAESITLVSSPAGLFTRIKLPLDSIYRKVWTDEQAEDPAYILNINHAALVVETADLEEYSGRLDPPAALLMIREEDMPRYFVQSLYPVAGIPTVMGVYNAAQRRYVFGKMGAYLQSVLKSGQSAFDAASEFVLVPVSGATDVNAAGNTIRHLLRPSGGILRSGTNASPMRVSITYTHL